MEELTKVGKGNGQHRITPVVSSHISVLVKALEHAIGIFVTQCSIDLHFDVILVTWSIVGLVFDRLWIKFIGKFSFVFLGHTGCVHW